MAPRAAPERAWYLSGNSRRSRSGRTSRRLSGHFRRCFGFGWRNQSRRKNKLAAFQAKFGERFCYIGNAKPDAEVLAACEAPMVANPDRALQSRMKSAGTVPIASFEDRGAGVKGRLKSWTKAFRLHQWAKNTLIFVPLLLAHAWNPGTISGALVAFVSFGLCASATYIINDLLDLEADRRHPSKRRRPFAAGDLSAIAGVSAVVSPLCWPRSCWPLPCRA